MPKPARVVAVIPGHNARAPGAYCPEPIAASEYAFYCQVVDVMGQMAGGDVVLRQIRRVASGSYRQEIAAAYAQAWDCAATVELHFNFGGPGARGTETLASGSNGSRRLAAAMQAEQLRALGLRDRGVKVVSASDRGGYSVHAGKPPAVLIEPFFASHEADRAAAGRLGVLGVAAMVLAGLARFLEFSPAPFPAPKKVLDPGDAGTGGRPVRPGDLPKLRFGGGLTKDAWFHAHRSLLEEYLVRAHAEDGRSLPVLPARAALAVMYAEVGLTDGKPDPYYVHSNGERGLFPLPLNLEYWTGAPCPAPGQLAPELNVYWFIRYLLGIVRSPAYGYFFADLEEAAAARVLAAVVHGYGGEWNFAAEIPFPRRTLLSIAATGNEALMLTALQELRYKHPRERVAARLANVAAGLALE